MKNRDMPAKPIHSSDGLRESGLTNLEKAAIAFMANTVISSPFNAEFKILAEDSVRYANALFDELEKE